MKHLGLALFGLSLAWSAPAFANDDCAECPRVQLLRVEDQVRIAAEDDEDAYEDLQFRVRFITANGASQWSEWADTNAYGLRTTISGRIEAESIDLEGYVGRAVIHITSPDAEPGTRGPGTVEEDSSVEARGSGEDGGIPAEDVEEPVEPAEQYLTSESYDHSICPVSNAEGPYDSGDAACSTTQSKTPSGALGVLLMFLAAVFVRRRS